MHQHERYMHRCLQLAALGAGYTAPNPMVGAVLVHENRMIGEGYHARYGEAHAEVNCINSVQEADRQLIPDSTLYVSLEPCAHFGKTPPCADLIIKEKIKKVVVGCRDPFSAVNGKGIEILKNAGVDVTEDILLTECLELNKRFFTFHQQQRPYIILKWAQSANGKIAGKIPGPLKISNAFADRLVHKWRSEEMAIMVGTNTALLDDPSLTTRLWKGKDPLRFVIDMDLKLSPSLKLFSDGKATVIFNTKMEETTDMVSLVKINREDSIRSICNILYEHHILSIIVEGGAKTLQGFIDEGIWDEARVIVAADLQVDEGLDAPLLRSNHVVKKESLGNNNIITYTNDHHK